MVTAIIGSGSYLPKETISNDQLESMISGFEPRPLKGACPPRNETLDEAISKRLRIHHRHHGGEEDTLISMGTAALQKAIEMAGIKGEDIGMVIVANSYPSDKDPIGSTLNAFIAKNVGAEFAAGYTINAQCAGFVVGVDQAGLYLKSNRCKYAAVVGTELLFDRAEKTFTSGTIFGDGSSALILSHDTEGPLTSSYTAFFGDYSEDNPDMVRYRYGEPIRMEKAVYRKACEAWTKLLEKSLLDADLTPLFSPDLLKAVILHQSNGRAIEEVAKRMEKYFQGFEEKTKFNISQVGNTSTASVGILTDELIRSGKLGHGDYAYLGGLAIGFMAIGTILRNKAIIKQ